MGLLDNISNAISGSLRGLENQASTSSKVSASSVANELINLGDQLSKASSDSAVSDTAQGLQAFKGQESGNTVLVMSDLNSKFHDGETSFLV